jgi:hypothetical protein
MVGLWPVGTPPVEYPEGTGLKVPMGAKLVLQIHYNTDNAPATTDETAVDFMLADHVDKEGVLVGITNPSWLDGPNGMRIPAGEPDVAFSYDGDAAMLPFLSGGVLKPGAPFQVHSVATHMHARGSKAQVAVEHGDGSNQCMLDIERWNFHWQRTYRFAESQTVSPGDRLHVECHFDNTAGHQPLVNGTPIRPRDAWWGEGTTQEMCISFVYLTQ